MDREPDATTAAFQRVRAWRQLAQQADQPRTAAQDSVVRLALMMVVFDARAGLEETFRQEMLALLHDTEQRPAPLTAEEKARFRDPLLRYLREHREKIYPIVLQQFREETADGET